MSRYSLYSDELDSEINEIMEAVRRSVAANSDRLNAILNSERAARLGVHDSEAHGEIIDAWNHAVKGKVWTSIMEEIKGAQ